MPSSVESSCSLTSDFICTICTLHTVYFSVKFQCAEPISVDRVLCEYQNVPSDKQINVAIQASSLGSWYLKRTSQSRESYRDMRQCSEVQIKGNVGSEVGLSCIQASE